MSQSEIIVAQRKVVNKALLNLTIRISASAFCLGFDPNSDGHRDRQTV